MMVSADVGGRIVSAGGGNRVPASTVSTGAFAFDPASAAWTSLPPLLASCEKCAGAAVGGRFHVTGGEADAPPPPTRPTALALNQVFDPATQAWSLAAPLPVPLTEHEAIALDGKLYVMGGYNSLRGQLSIDRSARMFDSVYVYTPAP
jgi:N-acetylneuraminic acid mutarotase